MKAESQMATAENLFVGGGEIAALVRAHDWSQTSLGAVDTWSDSLKTVVQILLTELDRAQSSQNRQLGSQMQPDCTPLAALRDSAQADAFRVRLTNALRPLSNATEIQATAARVLGEFLGVSRVIYIEVASGDEEVIVHKNYTNGVAQLSGRFRLEDYQRNLSDNHQAGQTQIVSDIPNNSKYTDAEKVRYSAIDIAAHIDVPLIKNNRFVALLAVHQSTPRQWTQDEVKRVEETAQQTWAAVERARAEAALRESEAKYRTLFESIDDGFCVIEMLFDPNDRPVDYRFLEINPSFERQSGLVQAVGRRMLELAPTHEKYWFEIYGKVAKTGESLRFENHAQALNRWFDVYAFRIGQLESRKVAVLFKDISDRKRSEAEREQLLQREQAAREAAENANRIKDEFLTVLSHELRTPLNPILGWTRLLQNGKLDASRQTEALKTIERNAKLQSQLIEDLLDISRIMQGKLSLIVAPVSLTIAISAAVETVRLAAEAKNIGLQIDLDTTTSPISGDATRLQQVVWNLLANAVKFTPNGGQITVKLRQVDGLAQMQVIDTGKGIQPQFLPHVFEYFQQEDSSTTRKFGGLGLGLAIVRQIVEMHGGTVKAESLGENQGAIFTVQLPVMRQTVATASEPIWATRADTQVSLNDLQILVVDNERDTREFQAFVLSQSGAKVATVASGLEALQVLDRFVPDVLVSDVGMPQMDGYMLMQQIRSRPVHRGGTIPAIALTAYTGDFERQKALRSGFGAYVTKPVEPEMLVRAIVNLLKPRCGSPE